MQGINDLSDFYKICAVGYDTSTFLTLNGTVNFFPETITTPLGTPYKGKISDLARQCTSEPLQALCEKKWNVFALSCTFDSVQKLLHNICAIAVHLIAFVAHFLFAVCITYKQDDSAAQCLQGACAHLTMILSNLNEIVRNGLRFTPFLGHFLGYAYQRFNSYLEEIPQIIALLNQKFALEYNYSASMKYNNRPVLLKVDDGVLSRRL